MADSMSSAGEKQRPSLTLIVMTLLAVLPIAAILILPIAWQAMGIVLGWYLRKKTDGRRHHILEVMEQEEKTFSATHPERKGSDDEWENVEAYATGTSGNGEKGQKEWDGIVGFFHPFWSVLPRLCWISLTLEAYKVF
jgi:alpha-1,2-mannosyltransferase